MNLTKKFLIKEYKIKSVTQIAKENNISNTCLYRIFNKYMINRRTQKEAGRLRIIKYLCKDCGRQVSRKEYKRCKICENKRKHKLGILNCKGKNNHFYGKHRKPNFIKYRNIWMRSSWEVAYAKYLDKQKIKWQYEPKYFDLEKTTYTPDFYLPETDMYIEIKGYKSNVFIKKFKLFKKLYPNIKIKILDENYFNKKGEINESRISR